MLYLGYFYHILGDFSPFLAYFDVFLAYFDVFLVLWPVGQFFSYIFKKKYKYYNSLQKKVASWPVMKGFVNMSRTRKNMNEYSRIKLSDVNTLDKFLTEGFKSGLFEPEENKMQGERCRTLGFTNEALRKTRKNDAVNIKPLPLFTESMAIDHIYIACNKLLDKVPEEYKTVEKLLDAINFIFDKYILDPTRIEHEKDIRDYIKKLSSEFPIEDRHHVNYSDEDQINTLKRSINSVHGSSCCQKTIQPKSLDDKMKDCAKILDFIKFAKHEGLTCSEALGILQKNDVI